MSKTALFITHKTLPGKREAVQKLWEKHLQPRIAANPGHEAYFYCFDNNDPDVICVYQQYNDREASLAFVQSDWYAVYVAEVTPLLAGEPSIRVATPQWSKAGV